MSPSTRRQLFTGTFVHSKSRTELEYLHDAVVAVDEKGVVVSIDQGCENVKIRADKLRTSLGWDDEEVDFHAYKDGHFFFPGFIGKPTSHLMMNRKGNRFQIRMSTHHSTLMWVSSARQPSWIG